VDRRPLRPARGRRGAPLRSSCRPRRTAWVSPPPRQKIARSSRGWRSCSGRSCSAAS
jgi:hypothetical protein